MGNEYSAIAAKLRAMHARFLTEKDYEALLAGKSVNDICAYLKNTDGYSDVLENVNEREIHRGVMELLLEQDIMEEYVRLYNFADRPLRRLLNFWFIQREGEFIKRELRHIYTKEARTRDEVSQGRFDAFFETHTKINREIMQNATSLDDCIKACGHTPYAEPLKRAQSVGADFFSLGMMLDVFLYTRIWREAHKSLKGEQITLFEQLIGSNIDMMNLMWIYRGKKYYDFPSEIIFTYLFPIRHRLSEDIIRRLVNADSMEQLVSLVRSETVYGGLFDDLENGRFPEENYRVIYNGISKRIFVNNSQSFAAMFAYLNLKEAEIGNITTITEGVRYGLNTEAIRAHVRL